MENQEKIKEDLNKTIDFDEPLSPVLCSNQRPRKYVPSRRKQRKARVNLVDRYTVDNEENEQKVEENYSGTFVDEAFTLSQQQNILESIEIFEKIEEEGSEVQKGMQCKVGEDFIFKKPLLPSPYCKNSKTFKGFQTAGGKSIQFTNEMVEKSKKLFNDILNPNNLDSSRYKKYSFLSKSKTDSISFKNDRVTEASKDENKITEAAAQNFVSDPSKSFTIGSEEKVISESALKIVRNMFHEVISSFESSLHSVTDINSNLEDTNTETNILCSQETDILFANFTTIEEKICGSGGNNLSEEFKGFDDNVIEDSKVKADEFITLLRELYFEGKKVYSHKKRPLQEFSSSPKQKRLKSLVIDVNKQSLTTFQGFTNASGTAKSLTKTQCVLNKEELDIPKVYGGSNSKISVGFQTASGNSLRLPKNAMQKAKQVFENITNEFLLDDLFSNTKVEKGVNITSLDNQTNSVRREHGSSIKSSGKEQISSTCRGFQTASGNSLKLSENATRRAKQVFENISNDFFLDDLFSKTKVENEDDNNSLGDKQTDTSRSQHVSIKSCQKEQISSTCMGFQIASRNLLRLSEDSLRTAKQIFKDDFPSDMCVNIDIDKENASFNELNLKTEKSVFSASSNGTLSRKKEDSVSKNTAYKVNQSKPGFMTASGNSFKFSEDALKRAKQIFQDDFPLDSTPSSTSIDKENTSLGETNTSTEKSASSLNNRQLQRKRRLGMPSCKPMQLSSDKLKKAKLLFADEKSLIHSPVRSSNQSSIYNSTPLKSGLPDSHVDPDITPIKPEDTVSTNSMRKHSESYGSDGRILIQECTKGNINLWSENLETEKQKLEAKLKIIMERQEALNIQKCLLKGNCQDHRKRRPGVLFNKKRSSDRVTLQNFLKLNTSFTKSLNISPKNAVLVHFNCADQVLPSVKTTDGASIIPSTRDVIGLPEIEAAFKVMAGVEPKLIPEGWIRNHFKWIVWKLASYERFTTNLKDSLTIENVIQQLKYRYDREIDGAERPTLRKIFEKDDVPQKRMVLCVSDIFNVADNRFELELTDGWYSIRTVIDEPLCSQIFNQKIVIGTKLITYGAELLNCDGCHPLEATDLVRLKISCNSTRRAVWYAKLGYQNYVEPFPLKLRSLYPAGGSVGCIKIYIARAYPIKYLEKKNKLTVWRNKKAEELQAQNWENERLKRVEEIREVARKDYEKSMQKVKHHMDINLNNSDIKNIKCPQTLYNLYQSSKDPESLEGVLSQTQINSIVEYQQHLSFLQQQEVNRKIQDGVNKLQYSQRDVTPVQQLLVIDVLDSQEKACVFQIWKPTETHLQILKESSTFYVYNVLSKKTGLSSTIRTKFKPVMEEFPQLQKYERTLLPISMIHNLVNKPLFNEFDTVGVVIQIGINSFNQALWLADASGKLLYINIFEGPKSCLLLDNLKSGQVVAVSNLIFCESKFEFREAIANHLTVISCYPQHKHLQAGLETINLQLPKDLHVFLEECVEKVKYYTDRINIINDGKDNSSKSLIKANPLSCSRVFDDSYEESTLTYSRITSTDVALSLIDIDKFT